MSISSSTSISPNDGPWLYTAAASGGGGSGGPGGIPDTVTAGYSSSVIFSAVDNWQNRPLDSSTRDVPGIDPLSGLCSTHLAKMASGAVCYDRGMSSSGPIPPVYDGPSPPGKRWPIDIQYAQNIPAVWVVPADYPRVKVTLAAWQDDGAKQTMKDSIASVPIPQGQFLTALDRRVADGSQPHIGFYDSDHPCVIYDPANDTMFEFWELIGPQTRPYYNSSGNFQPTLDHYECGSAGVITNASKDLRLAYFRNYGSPPPTNRKSNYGVRGSRLSVASCLVTQKEWNVDFHIPHPLFLVLPKDEQHHDEFCWPAGTSDGRPGNGFYWEGKPRQGSLFYLPASFSMPSGLTQHQEVLVTCMQEHGVIAVDSNLTGVTLEFQNTVAQGTTPPTFDWITNPSGDTFSQTQAALRALPWGSLVLRNMDWPVTRGRSGLGGSYAPITTGPGAATATP